MRPHPYRWDRPAHRIAVMDPVTGQTCLPGGETGWVAPTGGGVHTVHGLLRAAEQHGLTRIFLSGGKPKDSTWLDEPPPDGWLPNGHFYELRDPCGRWAYRDGRTVEVRRVASWFGEGDYSPETAWAALEWTHRIVQRHSRGYAGVMASPAATGQSWWASTLKPGQLDGQTDPHVADLIRSTSPQHREEVIGRCFDGCEEHNPPGTSKLAEVHYMDAAFMYGVCCRELGARAVLLDSERMARAHFDAYPYARARYRVGFTIPAGWDGPGLLPVKHPNGRNWHYPSLPGVDGETWADAAEVHLAIENGWGVEPLGLIRYEEKRRPLDTFAESIKRARAEITGDNELSGMVKAALRSMFIRTIGSFHSRGRERSYVCPAGQVLPEDVTAWDTRPNGDRIYKRVHEPTGNAAAFIRPELSSQVWARARVKVAQQMLSLGRPDSLIAVWGDAVYLDHDPGWRGDEPGMFRPKGYLKGPGTRPTTIGELLTIRRAMEAK